MILTYAFVLFVVIALAVLVYYSHRYGGMVEKVDKHENESKARDMQRRIAANLERLRKERD